MTTANTLVNGKEEVKELTAAQKRALAKKEKEAKAKAETEKKDQAVVIEKTVQIPVSGISSGKVNVYNFTYARKMIVTPFFPNLVADKHYGYDHHVNADRLTSLGEKHTEYTLFAHNTDKTPDAFKGITAQSHSDLVKYNLYKMIVDGKFSTVHNNVEYKMVWNGEPIAEPTIKIKEVKEKAEKKPSQDELAGLNFADILG